MSGFFLSFLLLPLALFLIQVTAAAESPSASPDANLIAQACQQATQKDLCINLLTSDRNSPKADLRGLAFIALRLAQKNATDASLFIHQTLANSENQSDAARQALSDCGDHYITAVELMEDSTSSFVSYVYDDVTRFAEAAIADLDTCDAIIKDQKGSAMEVVAIKNNNVRRIINTALDVARVAATAKATL